MKNEKNAKEAYLKSVITNLNKVRDIKTKLEKEGTHKFVIMIDLLKIYGEVLEKLQVSLANEVTFIAENFMRKLETGLKEDKVIKEKLQNSVDLMEKYMKQLRKIDNYRRSMMETYNVYEQTVLIDDTINRIVQTYSDEPLKKTTELAKNNFAAREYEYNTALAFFNEEAPSLLKQNVGLESSVLQSKEMFCLYRKSCLYSQRSCRLCHQLPHEELGRSRR